MLSSLIMSSSFLPMGHPALANNVRLEDVDNPELKAGLEAATSGRFPEAEVIFGRLLSDDPSLASLWSNMGNVHLSMGRAAEAYEDFSRAISLAPSAPVPYLNRAIALEELGVHAEEAGQAGQARDRWQAALADCEAAIARDPTEFAAWFNKGNVQLRLAQYDSARASFTTAADLAPGIAGYRLRAAQLAYQCGDTGGAQRTVKGVVRKNPRYAEAHATLAAMLWRDGQLAAAEGQLNTALELGGRWGDAGYVAASTRWPPALAEALARLVQLEVPPSTT